MIKSLAELEDSTRKLAKKCPLIADEIIVSPPGISAKEKAALMEAIPGLPDSYLHCIESLGFEGVAFSYFSLSPGVGKNRSMVEGLVLMNSIQNGLFERLWTKRLAQIGHWDSEPVVVACSGSELPLGAVYMIDHEDPDASPVELAPDFEVFVLILGNLSEVVMQDHSSEGAIEFGRRLEQLNLTPQVQQNWLPITEETFS